MAPNDPTATLEDDDLLDEDPDFEDDTEEDEEDEEDDLEDEEDDAEEVGTLLCAAADTEADDDSNDDGRENAVDEDDLDGSSDPSLDPLEAETIRRRLEAAIVPLTEVPPPSHASAI